MLHPYFMGMKKVYFVIGENKIEKDYDSALYRARNIEVSVKCPKARVVKRLVQ